MFIGDLSKLDLGLPWDWRYLTELMAVRGDVQVINATIYLLHFDQWDPQS